MKERLNYYIIGVDHGYGNIKTANCCFPTGVVKCETEPIFGDVLKWNGAYYSIGAGHKEFLADKFSDEDYYVLTLAAIAKELKRENITDASVMIAAGLPLTWVSRQKEEFRKYLLQNEEVTFTFKGTDYHIRIVGAEIFPQGFAAVAEYLNAFYGITMLCDIGNGTMNILRIVNGKPDPQKMYTEKYGTHQCTLLIREAMMKHHHTTLDDVIITEFLQNGYADIPEEYLETIQKVAEEYSNEILHRLRDHDYDPKLMRLHVVGGGGCLLKNFMDCDNRVFFEEDICATAKGYEYLTEITLKRGRKA